MRLLQVMWLMRLLQVVEQGEGEGEVLLLDLLDDILELDFQSPLSHFHSLDITLFSRWN